MGPERIDESDSFPFTENLIDRLAPTEEEPTIIPTIIEEVIDAPLDKVSLRLGDFDSGRLFIMEFRDSETKMFGTVCQGIRENKVKN